MKGIVRFGVMLNILLWIGHLACLPFLDEAFSFYGIDAKMAELSHVDASLPYILTMMIATAFLAVACYGLSYTGDMSRLPLQHLSLAVILLVFFGRFVWGLTRLIENFTWLGMSSTAISLLLGLCYVPAVCLLWPRNNARIGKQTVSC